MFCKEPDSKKKKFSGRVESFLENELYLNHSSTQAPLPSYSRGETTMIDFSESGAT